MKVHHLFEFFSGLGHPLREWAHLDISGVDIFQKPTDFTAEGYMGFGVRLLATFFINLANSK
jgi:leucyl aminopeptidase